MELTCKVFILTASKIHDISFKEDFTEPNLEAPSWLKAELLYVIFKYIIGCIRAVSINIKEEFEEYDLRGDEKYIRPFQKWKFWVFRWRFNGRLVISLIFHVVLMDEESYMWSSSPSESLRNFKSNRRIWITLKHF